jgi:hypothetical protein
MTDLIIVNAGLSRLFHDCSCFETDPHAKAEYENQARACHQNLEILVTRLPLTAPYTFDLALALSMAVRAVPMQIEYQLMYFLQSTQFMDRLRPLQAWKLIVHAASICQCLGFNRGSSPGAEGFAVYRNQKRLFLIVCTIEKYLAFRLGKASTIRSSEIPPVDIEMSDGYSPSLNPLWEKWISITLLQDQVYDDLYSPKALLQSEDTRESRARSLAAELQRLFGPQDATAVRYPG